MPGLAQRCLMPTRASVWRMGGCQMFKDILVPILSRRGDMDALNAGVALAESEGARLTVLQLVYLPTTFSNNWALARDVASGEIYRKLREEGEASVARLKTRLETESVRTEIR